MDMGDVVNLNRFRKDKARKDRASAAERNRILHGLTKDEKKRERAEAERKARDLEGKKLDDPV
jgi:hypothetical protein